jgi:hypothetical protein
MRDNVEQAQALVDALQAQAARFSGNFGGID